MTFPAKLDELPNDWRAALTNRLLLWKGGYDPALVEVREGGKTAPPIDTWYLTFIWLFYSRDPQELSETHDAFVMPAEWRHISIAPAPSGTLPSLRAALAWRFAHFFGVRFDDPVVMASVEYAFSSDHDAGPIGYLADVSNRLWLAANRWRKCQRRADMYPWMRLRADDHLSAQTDMALLHGVVLPADHEFWSACFPPNHVTNVGMIEQVSPSGMRRLGYALTTDLREDWRSLIPNGFDRNFAAVWPDVAEPGMVRMSGPN
jgi:hypothetical protein